MIRNVFNVLEPIWKKRAELISNPARLTEIAAMGTEKARKIAEETMVIVRETMGLR